MPAHFEIISEISGQETFAQSSKIREIERLRKTYRTIRWRKQKGIATVRPGSGKIAEAELHCYEAAGIGRKEFRIKRFLD